MPGAPVHRFVLALIVVGALSYAPAPAGQPQQRAAGFAGLIAELSEPPGYFDTDNLISNERSYLEVLPDLRRLAGGAYIGVGPDQNFSYIAAARPDVAFIIDVRRDNLLLHLLFKALFSLSKTRAEYLALLFGRTVPQPLDQWRAVSIERLARHIDDSRADGGALEKVRASVTRQVLSFGVPLSPEDLSTIERFHRRFVAEGLDLRFHSTGRPPQSYYPTYRELLLAQDPSGRPSSFLAAEAGFQFVRSLQLQDRVIPVTGNLAGSHALVAIGRVIAARGERLTMFYASNVEQYLFRSGSFPRFVENLERIPHDERTLIVRSVFGGWDGSSSHVQPVSEMLRAATAGRIRGYYDLIGRR